MESNTQNHPFLIRTMSYLSSQLERNDVNKGEELVTRKKPMDPRLVILLRFFHELYCRRSDLFGKLFPELRHGLREFMEKLEAMMVELEATLVEEKPIGRAKVRPLQRSLSVGSPRIVSRGLDEKSSGDLKLERFKIRTVDIDNDGGNPSGGQGGGSGDRGGGGTKPGCSK